MKNAIISADIISSTSLTEKEFSLLLRRIKDTFALIEAKYNKNDISFFGRLIKGDYIECYLKNPSDALRVALILKSAVKSCPIDAIAKKETRRRKLFRQYGVRLAVGIGEMRTVNLAQGILDGDAIYLSGRKINEQKSYNKGKIIVKNTLFFETAEEELKERFSVITGLLDRLLTTMTMRQSEVLYYKLQEIGEQEIAQRLNISQSSVNQHSTALGWNVIEQTVRYYEHTEF
ncbi:MAG: RNA polymerase subunit sigma-70 [Bacteroidales bacterium]|nr:RNA polymerase subunit sigma-70 [Bacteroidales bacterium]